MIASRVGVISAAYSVRFWLSACCAALMPTSIGYQDLAALIAHRSGAPSASVSHFIASPFGTIEPATFSYSRPVGTAIPDPLGNFQTVNFDPRSLDAFSWKIDEPVTTRPAHQMDYPSVNRENKGDRLPVSNSSPAPAQSANPSPLQSISAPDAAPAAQPVAPAAPAMTPAPAKTEMHADA